MQSLREIQKQCHAITVSKGFNLGEHTKQMLLIASEVAELAENLESEGKNSPRLNAVLRQFKYLMYDFEQLRKHTDLVDHSELKKSNNVEEELDDIVIRCCCYAEELGIDLETSILKKLEKNKKRPYLHGKKF